MKRLLLAALAGLICLSAWAQNVRTNYRSGGITHISTDYESLTLGAIPAQIRVELAGFPDGGTLYLLYINLVEKNATVVPKGVKMAVTLKNGKIIRLEQIGSDSATKRRLEDGNFLNRLKYAVESKDMEALVKGVKSADIITGWNPEDYIQAAFPANELGELLLRHCQAILKASEKTIDLGDASLASHSENQSSVLTDANPVMARGAHFDYNVLLSHLYYKATNTEDIDLAFVIGSKNQEKFHIPYDAPVRLTLRDGSLISLPQARDDENFVYLYPSMEDLYRICSVGIASLAIDHEGGTLEDSFPEASPEASIGGLSDAINRELQLLLSVSPR